MVEVEGQPSFDKEYQMFTQFVRIPEQAPPYLAMPARLALRRPTQERLRSSAVQWANVFGDPDTIVSLETELERPPTALEITLNYTVNALRASRGINNLQEQVGGRGDAGKANYLISSMLEEMALGVVQDHGEEIARDKTIPDYLSRLTTRLFNDDNERNAWFAPKLLIFNNALRQFLEMRETVGLLDARPEAIESAASLKAENDRLFEITGELQKYGVKTAIVPSELEEANVREWLVFDESEQRDFIRATGEDSNQNTVYLPRFVAGFISTDQRFATSRIAYGAREGERDDGVKVLGFNLAGVVEPVDADKETPGMAIKLGRDGELYTEFHKPLSDFLRNASTYETLRAEILSMYADSVVPVYVYDLFKLEERDIARATEPSNRPHLDKMRRLVLARERVVSVLGDDLTNALENGVESEPVAHREMVDHPVVGHKRDLPPTHRASWLARERYRDATGKELPEFGMTYVKKHRRGNLEDSSPGHRVDRRRKVVDEIINLGTDS